MKVIEPGHVYELATLDGGLTQQITFVNREEGTEHGGTQTQEVLRVTVDVMDVLIDRTNHCDRCLRWENNDRIIKALSEAQRQMRLALLYHEQRAMERKLDRGDLLPEAVPVEADGHFKIQREATAMKLKYCEHGSADGHCLVLDCTHNRRNLGRGGPHDVGSESSTIAIPMLLHCPMCGARHVDRGIFATRIHRTHVCQNCGHVWRPANVPTVGVQFLPGFKDEP